MLPGANKKLVDLVSHLLTYDACLRLTAVEALDHAFFASIRKANDEPVAETPFDFSFEQLREEDMKAALREEVENFRMEVRGE
jgi:hypothetical protein